MNLNQFTLTDNSELFDKVADSRAIIPAEVLSNLCFDGSVFIKQLNFYDSLQNKLARV